MITQVEMLTAIAWGAFSGILFQGRIYALIGLFGSIATIAVLKYFNL